MSEQAIGSTRAPGRVRRRRFLVRYGVYLSLLLLLIVAAVVTPSIYSRNLLFLILRQASQLGLAGMARAFLKLEAKQPMQAREELTKSWSGFPRHFSQFVIGQIVYVTQGEKPLRIRRQGCVDLFAQQFAIERIHEGLARFGIRDELFHF